MTTETTIYEKIDHRQTVVCDLGHPHKNVPVMRVLHLAIVEERTVPNNYLRAYGYAGATGTGYRAVDQFGDEWFSSWHSDNHDGSGYGGRFWSTEDGGRKATDKAPHAGWVKA